MNKLNNVRVRFAPSPTGDPHLGAMRTALFNWAFARKNDGKFILRIEDTDRNRLVPGSTENIIEGLKWLNLNYDEGPEVGGNFGPYFQSERKELYLKVVNKLLDEDKAYMCDLSSDELIGGFDELKGKKIRIEGYLEEFSLSRKEADDLIMAAREIVYR